MNKETRIKVIAGSIFGLVLVLGVTLLPIWGDDEQKTDDGFDTVPKLSQDDAFSIDDMTSFKNDDYTIKEDTEEPSSSIDNMLDRINAQKQKEKEEIVTEDDIYENENSESTLAIQETIKALEAQKLALQRTSNTSNTTTQAPPHRVVPKEVKPELTEEEKQLAYIERLEKAKNFVNDNINEVVEKFESVTIEAVVYEDQFVLPGDRLEMVLSKDVNIRGKSFPRGTPVFAMVEIRENRVLLDIQNIQGTSYSVFAHDPQDFREGLYSTRAGELWKEYKQAQKDRANEEASSEIVKSTKSKILGSAFKDLATFFKNKRLRKDRKIPVLNDDKVLLKIK